MKDDIGCNEDIGRESLLHIYKTTSINILNRETSALYFYFSCRASNVYLAHDLPEL